jgi:LemA protein
MSVLFALVIIGALVWAVIAYNRLVQLRNRIAGVFRQIDAQIKRRHDLIATLSDVARKHVGSETAPLEAVTNAHDAAVTAADTARAMPNNPVAIDDLSNAEQTLTSALGRLMLLQEQYPQLKADQTLQSLSADLASAENRISLLRQTYNDQAQEFNNEATQFPALAVARLFGFETAAILQSAPAERQTPREQP